MDELRKLWQQNSHHSRKYEKTLKGKITVHIGYESISDEYHDNSSHWRLIITGEIRKAFPNALIVHLSVDTSESLRNCKRIQPDVALLSHTLLEEDGISLQQ